MNKKLRVGDILIQAGVISQQELKAALQLQKTLGKKLGETLISEGFISEETFLLALESQLGIPYLNLNSYKIDKAAVRKIKEHVARKNSVIPIAIKNEKLVIATADPLDIYAVEDVKLAANMETVLILAGKDDILQAINTNYDSQDIVDKALEEFDLENIEIPEEDLEDVEVSNAPIVRLVNTIFERAVKKGVSDIHIEPYEDRVRVRYRIDGHLEEEMSSSKSTHSALTTRIKLIGGMDISEKRRPQDGRVETKILDREIDMRISILPTVFGEKTVIRILDGSKLNQNSGDLHMTRANQDNFDKILRAPEGLILITGPTGSGKSTTLYSVLNSFNSIDRNIITVEDPVEYRMDGINQVQTNEKAGLTFATALRSILRQDPDVVMVGEIRDSETAQIACRASITGHVVLSTLHTNDTASTISRLTDMEIENYVVSSALVGIVAQRLVRKICPHCITEYTITEEEMMLSGIDKMQVYKGKGCNYCSQTGYKGRLPVHEIMVIDKEMKKMISTDVSVDEIKEYAIKQGMNTLKESCYELVKNGETTVSELLKIAFSVETN